MLAYLSSHRTGSSVMTNVNPPPVEKKLPENPADKLPTDIPKSQPAKAK